jgi:hypothetical protein
MLVLEYRGTSFASRFIRWWAWKRYSHTSLTFARVHDGQLVGDLSEWESWQTHGVEHVPMIGMNHKRGTRIDLYELRHPLDRSELEAGMLFLSAQLGKKYDWWGIMGFAFRAKTQSDNKWFCCELVFQFLRMCGRVILQGVEAYQTTPGSMETSPEFKPDPIGYLICGEGVKVYQDQPPTVDKHQAGGVVSVVI